MKQQINMDLLKQSDEVTEEHIAEEFPYPLKKTETFEKAYQNYLKQSDQMEDRSLTNRSRRRRLYRVGSLVACLLLTVGLGLGIWTRQQRLESRPPQEIPAFTQMETSTQTQTAAVSTVQTTAVTEYSQTETISSTKQTTLAGSTGTAAQTAAIAVQPWAETTASPVDEPSQEPIVIVPEPPVETMAPPPAETELFTESETTVLSETVQTESSTPLTTTTEPPSIDTSPLGGDSSTATSPVHGDGSYPGEPGFHTEDNGTFRTITPVCTGDEPEDFELTYQITGERYRIESLEVDDSGSTPCRLYQLYDTELERYWLLSQFPMKGFSQNIYWDNDTDWDGWNVQVDDLQKILPVELVSGFVITDTFPAQSPEYTVCWTDGNYVMVMSGSDSRLLTLDLPDHFRAE